MGKEKVTDRWHARRQPIFEHPEIPQIDKWLAELTTIQRMVEFHDFKTGKFFSIVTLLYFPAQSRLSILA